MIQKLCLLFFVVWSTFSFAQNSLFLNGPINYVQVGDLDVAGNQLTIEALINYTGPSVNIVSKHTDPSNVNYLFRPGSFEITTTSGFAAFGGVAAAGVTLTQGETYHLAATYNGQFLRYYVNGCLTGEMPWTGNMVQNNLLTAIGQQSSCQCEQFNGYIDEVRIWNVARTQAEIGANMLDLPNPTIQPGLLAYYKFEGNFLNVQGNAAWNGVAVGAPQLQPIPYPYPTLSGVNATSSPVICENTATGAINIAGNGGYLPYTYSIDGTNFFPSPEFNNLTPGNYTVYARSNANCVATTTVTIENNPILLANHSATNVSCNGGNDGSATINPTGGNGAPYQHEWSNGNTNDLTINSLSQGNYSVQVEDSCKMSGNELVINGHFENGNTGFVSDYTYCTNCFSGSSDLPGGQYLIGHNANLHHGGFQGLGNGGNGNFMQVNGSEFPNTNVWCQTINVTPNTYYVFSSWVSSIHPASPAQLQFSANGDLLGPVFSAPNVTSLWSQFFGTWYSGAATTATICIVNQNTDPSGNDFGLDDISFKECVSCQETVNFSITEPSQLILDIIISNELCSAGDGEIDIIASGGTPGYEYSIDNGLTYQTSGTFSNLSAGIYDVQVRDLNDCQINQVVNVQQNGNVVIVSAGNDQTICVGEPVVLSASGTADFTWDNGIVDGEEFTPNETMTYTVTATDQFGCTATDDVTVTVNPLPVVFAGNDQTICAGENVVLQATGANTYHWEDGIQNNVIFNPITTQTYTVTGIDGNNCSNSDNVTVTVNQLPVVSAGPDQQVCAGTQVVLAGSGAQNYVWTNGVVNGVGFVPSNTQTYTVSGTDINGCISTDNVVVTVLGLPVIFAGIDQTVCENSPITLTASGGVSYVWDNGVINGQPFAQLLGSITYTVLGQDVNGCINSDQVIVTVVALPNPSFMVQNVAGCAPIDVIFVNTTSGNIVNCSWNFGDGTSGLGCNSVTHTYVNGGCQDASLTVTSVDGCSNTITEIDAVCIYDQPIADFYTTPNEITTLNPTANFINTSVDAVEYIWEFGDYSGQNIEENPSHIYEEPGYYEVVLMAYNVNGCVDTTTQLIFIKDELIFYVPNSFTPDGDKFNDEFLPIFTSGFDPYKFNLLIYNRWGEILFESNNSSVGWNGTYGGKIAPSGTYIWQITFEVSQVDKPEIHRGHVNILR